MPSLRLSRRKLAAALSLAIAACVPALPAWAQQPADYGWTVPYEKISDKSVAWLKDKGWWPMTVAFQPPWSGQNTINIVMDRAGLMTKRGVEAKWQAFPSGPAINEVMVSARAQVGNGGNFPFSSLVDKKVPVKSIGIVSPNLLHALVVPNDSPIKSVKDLKGAAEPHTIGIVTGSSAEFYFQMAAQVNGLQVGKDVILKNMPPGEQMAMPKGLAAVVPWDPTPTMIVEDRKLGRIVDMSFAYNIYEGTFYVRQELVDNVPDVVQAYADAMVEATLWIRAYPEKAADMMAEDPNLKNFPKATLLQQIKAYNLLYKPTYVYPHAKFWGEANEPIFTWLYQQKRIQNPLKGKDFEAAVDASFLAKTFDKLGWNVPKQPVFLPANWSHPLDKLPYPEFLNPVNGKNPQSFPEPGDLKKAWSFGGKTYNP